MKTRNVALVLLYTEGHKIFLQDRRSISKWGEKWGFWGGKIEEGETPEQAAVREIKEELDFDIKDFTKIGVNEGIQIRINSPHQEINTISHVFVYEITEDINQFTILEGDGGKFFTIEEARDMLVPYDHKTLDFLENYFKTH